MNGKPGVLAVMRDAASALRSDFETRSNPNPDAELREAITTVEQMYAALLNSNNAIALMVEGRQVNVVVTMRDNQAALAAFRGES